MNARLVLLRRSVVRFVCEGEGGQASLLVLNLLIPMVLAVGMMMRVDNMVTQKIRLQNAVDATTLEVGSLVARTMNQIALHNSMIVKRHSLVASTRAAIKGAQDAQSQAQRELARATSVLACWTRHVIGATVDTLVYLFDQDPGSYNSQFGGPGTDPEATALRQSQQCVSFISGNIIPNWQAILSFWGEEISFLQDRLNTFEQDLGQVTDQLGSKSQQMLDDMDDAIQEILDRQENVHRVEELFVVDQTGNWLQAGTLDTSLILSQASPSDYTDIGFTGVDDTDEFGQSTQEVRGFRHFEGPPAGLDSNYAVGGPVADKDAGTKQQDTEWGPTRYYLEFIKNVHFSTPGYHEMPEMHGPRGNPDSKYRDCGRAQGESHPGCDQDRKAGGNPCPNDNLNGSYCAQSTVNACIDDVTDYTRDTAIETAENQIRSENDGAFQEGNETMFRLAESPELEWTIGGRSRANRSRPDSNRSQRLNDQFAHNPGYFASLIPANTIQGSPTTAPDRGNYDDESVSVLSRFRLYNLTESEGQVIPEPDEWSDYPDALLTQDWNTIIVPIRRSLDSSGPAGTADRQLPAASGLHQWTKDALLH